MSGPPDFILTVSPSAIFSVMCGPSHILPIIDIWEDRTSTCVYKSLILLVGAAGFEPTTCSTQNCRATRLRYTPNVQQATSIHASRLAIKAGGGRGRPFYLTPNYLAPNYLAPNY